MCGGGWGGGGVAPPLGAFSCQTFLEMSFSFISSRAKALLARQVGQGLLQRAGGRRAGARPPAASPHPGRCCACPGQCWWGQCAGPAHWAGRGGGGRAAAPEVVAGLAASLPPPAAAAAGGGRLAHSSGSTRAARASLRAPWRRPRLQVGCRRRCPACSRPSRADWAAALGVEKGAGGVRSGRCRAARARAPRGAAAARCRSASSAARWLQALRCSVWPGRGARGGGCRGAAAGAAALELLSVPPTLTPPPAAPAPLLAVPQVVPAMALPVAHVLGPLAALAVRAGVKKANWVGVAEAQALPVPVPVPAAPVHVALPLAVVDAEHDASTVSVALPTPLALLQCVAPPVPVVAAGVPLTVGAGKCSGNTVNGGRGVPVTPPFAQPRVALPRGGRVGLSGGALPCSGAGQRLSSMKGSGFGWGPAACGAAGQGGLGWGRGGGVVREGGSVRGR